MNPTPTRAPALHKLQRSSGRFAMLALDQRESLRAMFPKSADGEWANDDALRAFKAAGVAALTPHASAVLLDRPYAVVDSAPAGLHPSCGLIVAADVLHQETGSHVTHSSFDERVTVEYLQRVGADAIKFLVIWRAGSGRSEREELVARAVELARAAGVASLVEAVVQPDDDGPWESEDVRHEAILRAAEEVAAARPDVYKAQVPGYRKGDLSQIEQQSAELTRIVGVPWVVLSNGVDRQDFAGAVRQACRGGASGFLAGRAIWADIVGSQQVEEQLRTTAAARLQELAAIVDEQHADV